LDASYLITASSSFQLEKIQTTDFTNDESLVTFLCTQRGIFDVRHAIPLYRRPEAEEIPISRVRFARTNLMAMHDLKGAKPLQVHWTGSVIAGNDDWDPTDDDHIKDVIRFIGFARSLWWDSSAHHLKFLTSGLYHLRYLAINTVSWQVCPLPCSSVSRIDLELIIYLAFNLTGRAG
jgi:hypothetical protein